MDLSGKRVLVIGGAGLIGSHTVDALLATDVAEVRIYDNFSRGRAENIAGTFNVLEACVRGGIPLGEGLARLIAWRSAHKAEVERRRREAGIVDD